MFQLCDTFNITKLSNLDKLINITNIINITHRICNLPEHFSQNKVPVQLTIYDDDNDGDVVSLQIFQNEIKEIK